MKSKKQKTFEDWMGEDVSWIYEYGENPSSVKRKHSMAITRYNFAKEVWAAAGGKFKSDEVNDEAN